MNFSLGIDGGGTKTAFRLEDADGNVVSELTLGACNPNDVGMDACLDLISGGCRSVCRGHDMKDISVFAGVAGAASGDNAVHIRSCLEELGFGAACCGSDFENALQLARMLAGDELIVLIAGTGSVACSLHNGRRTMIGGLGYLLDSTGSGFFLGREALTAALKETDGMAPESLLLPLCEAKLGMPVRNSIADIYRGGKPFIASFAPVVFEAERKGDAAAADILDRNARGMAELVQAALKSFDGADTPVVITGGLCHEHEALDRYLRRYIPEQQTVIYTTDPMVIGAADIARERAAD